MPNRATLDVPKRPVTRLHATIEPPGGANRLADLDDEQLLSVRERLHELVAALTRVHGCDGFNLFVNDGRYGRQTTGEMPDEDGRLRFHVLGRRGDEPVAPTTILNAPDDFPLERIPEAERTRRLAELENDAPGSDRPAPASAAADQPSEETCSLCAVDESELVRGDSARVIRPQRPLIPANVMLLPLRHVAHVTELTGAEFLDLFRMAERVAATFGQVHGSTSFNLFANDGRSAGQHVPHLHVHVFGRSEREDTDPYQLLRALRFRLRG